MSRKEINTKMILFQRGLFDSETETKYFLPFFSKIEELNNSLFQMPDSDKVRFFSESIVEQWVKERDSEKVMASLIYEIYNRIKFLFYINIFKTKKLIDALTVMYNTKNYLGWTLIGRSVIEHSAVLYYFWNKLHDLNLHRTSYKMNELEQIENILIKYSHGTRFNWDDLLAGNFDALSNVHQPNEENKTAVNILTALKHLSNSRATFNDMEVIYSMFSDFAHPNMASHSVFINLSEDAIETGENELALNVNRDRGEFILVATLPAIALNLGNIGDLIHNISKILDFWLKNVITGQIEIQFDES